MKRRQRIIISVTGIFIVLLALIGLTYAYFLTRITGNTNTTSINVTTSNLVLEYVDGNGRIAPTGKIEPGWITDGEDGRPNAKTFTVTNKGNSIVDYVVVFEDVVNEISRHPDLVYTLTCGVYSKNDINTDGTLKNGATKTGDCNGVTETNFPRTTDLEIVVRNSVAVDYANYYVLTIHYKEMNVDQSVDMGKTFEAHVNIKDPNEYNPYQSDKDTLAYNIINNSITGTNGTKYRTTTLSKVAEETNVYNLNVIDDVPLSEIAELSYEWYDEDWNNYYDSCTDDNMIGVRIVDDYGYFNGSLLVTGCNGDEPIVEGPLTAKESSLSLTDDTYTEDSGIKSYYYRGNIEDNYVTFSNKCWRIVRIQGDGSIKLTLESQSSCSETMTSDFSIGEANWGYYKNANNKSIGDYKNSTSGMKNLLTTWFDTNFKSDGNLTNAGLKIKNEEWCLGNITETYAYNSPYGELGTTAEQNYASGIKFYYETGRNLGGYGVTPNATLICNGETDASKIGALTADEVVFAGGKVGSLNTSYYLQNGKYYWWTLSRSSFYGSNDFAFGVDRNGNLDDNYYVSNSDYVRPAVSLNTGVKIISGGEGTLKNPYIINE